MFSNFYLLDLHDNNRVASPNLQWSMCKNAMIDFKWPPFLNPSHYNWVLQLVLIRFTRQDSHCITISTMKHMQKCHDQFQVTVLLNPSHYNWVLQLLLIRLTRQDLRCVTNSIMKHLQKCHDQFQVAALLEPIAPLGQDEAWVLPKACECYLVCFSCSPTSTNYIYMTTLAMH